MYTGMADKDRCSIVSPPFTMSNQGRADALAKSLYLRIRSLGINQNDEDDEAPPIWHHNGNGVQEVESFPLSPEEEEAQNPFCNSVIQNHHINPDNLTQRNEREYHRCGDNLNIVPNKQIPTNGDLSSSFGASTDNSGGFLLECSSSIDEIYETASDRSADEDIWENERNSTLKNNSVSTIEIEKDCSSSGDDQNFTRDTPEICITREEDNRGVSPVSYNSDESEETTPKVRRCSSLKTGKTPPGTPGNKKIVRFADALGLDLADVKTFIDEIPKVPTSAFHDLRNLDDEPNEFLSAKNDIDTKPERTLIPMFQQPVGLPDFIDRVRYNFVSLENAVVDDPLSFSIRGIVRVRNIDFHKSVFIRYSTDSWKNFGDIQASYVQNSCDGFSDRFSFLIYANTLNPGQIIEFAVVFQARGEQFWDNNRGSNYIFQCISTHPIHLSSSTHIIPSAWEDDHWSATFY